MKNDTESLSNDCASLFAAFVQVRDRKARAEIIKLAERCSFFDDIGIVQFSNVENPRER